MDYYIAKVSCQYTRLQRQQHATRKPKQSYRHVSPTLAAILTVTFHPSISGSMHADGLPRTIYLLTLVLIPEAAFLLKCIQPSLYWSVLILSTWICPSDTSNHSPGPLSSGWILNWPGLFCQRSGGYQHIGFSEYYFSQWIDTVDETRYSPSDWKRHTSQLRLQATQVNIYLRSRTYVQNNCSCLSRKQDPSSDHTGEDPSKDRNGNCRWTGGIPTRQGDKRSNHEPQRILMHKAHEHQQPLYVCFVDFKKAFDSISHDKLWVTMMDMGYPLHLIDLLAKL